MEVQALHRIAVAEAADAEVAQGREVVELLGPLAMILVEPGQSIGGIGLVLRVVGGAGGLVGGQARLEVADGPRRLQPADGRVELRIGEPEVGGAGLEGVSDPPEGADPHHLRAASRIAGGDGHHVVEVGAEVLKKVLAVGGAEGRAHDRAFSDLLAAEASLGPAGASNRLGTSPSEFLMLRCTFVLLLTCLFACSDSPAPPPAETPVGETTGDLLGPRPSFKGPVLKVAVDGMVCVENCATKVQARFAKVPGVAKVWINFPDREAQVELSGSESQARVVQALHGALEGTHWQITGVQGP